MLLLLSFSKFAVSFGFEYNYYNCDILRRVVNH